MVDETATRRQSGVGLGLAIVQELTTLMGGTVSVTSPVGQGTTFSVVLPLRLVQEETDE
ncbi:MAG: sensor histidine kinase, partial [Chloroflexi bacterium]|nr:sensor histidine kinase [Chloroflexota bacterium]